MGAEAVENGDGSMRHICAWCGTRLEPMAGPAHRVSHGICAECRDGLILDNGMPVLEFLDSLDVPTLLVDRGRRIGAATEEAAREFGGTRDRLVGQRLGLIFDCAYASEQGDCGLSIHCSGCTIRRTVCHTHATGESRNRVPATLKKVHDAGPADVVMWISTRRVGDRVLVRIDTAPEPH
jgi:hypothetical protein